MNDIERIIDDLKTTVEFLLQDRYVSKSTKEEFDLAISALEKQQYFRNCKDCGCFEGNCNYDRCTKFDIGVNPELDGCTFYEDWGVWDE